MFIWYMGRADLFAVPRVKDLKRINGHKLDAFEVLTFLDGRIELKIPRTYRSARA